MGGASTGLVYDLTDSVDSARALAPRDVATAPGLIAHGEYKISLELICAQFMSTTACRPPGLSMGRLVNPAHPAANEFSKSLRNRERDWTRAASRSWVKRVPRPYLTRDSLVGFR